MNNSLSQKQSPVVQRLHNQAFSTAKSRQHLRPIYSSVWLALIHGLMHPASDPINDLSPPN